MFVIFGWPNLKSGSQSLSMPCSRCRRVTVHNAHTLRQWFSLFFIPIFPLGGKRPHAICCVCGQDVYAATSGPSPLPALPNAMPPRLAAPESSRPTKRCPACAEEILLDAALCRFCGRQFSAQEAALSVQTFNAQQQAMLWADRQARLAAQRQRHVAKLRGRHNRRMVAGILLIGWGALISLGMVGMFFSTPDPGKTKAEQRTAAVASGCVMGLAPLAGGILLVRAARSVAKSMLVEQPVPARQFLFCANCGSQFQADASFCIACGEPAGPRRLLEQAAPLEGPKERSSP